MLKRGKRVVGALGMVAAVAFTGVLSATGSPDESSLSGWPRQMGSSEYDYINAVATTASGDVYVAGSTDAALSTLASAGGWDVWLARFDKFGKLKWVQQFGTAADDDVASMVVTGSSVYVVGSTGGSLAGNTASGGLDGYVARFDTSGNSKWFRQFGTAESDEALSVAVSGRSIWVLGATSGTLPGLTSVGNGDAALLQYNSAGSLQSSRQFGTDGYDYPNSIAVSGSTLYIGGSTAGTFAGQVNAGGTDGFLMRISNINTRRESTWVRQMGTAAADEIVGVAVSGGAVYTTGYTRGTLPDAVSAGGADGFVARYSTSGVVSWLRQFGTAADEELNAIATVRGGVVVAGSTGGAFAGFEADSLEAFTAKFSSTGAPGWLRQFGTASTDSAVAMAIRPSDNYGGQIVVAGYTGGRLWGQAALGKDDGFVATFLS